MMTKKNLEAGQSVVDLKFIRNIVGADDRSFEKELFEVFLVSSQKDFQSMQDALEKDNSNGWYLASHSFKGSAASMGAFDLAKSLETAQFHKSGNIEEKRQILAEVRLKLDLVRDFFKKELKKTD